MSKPNNIVSDERLLKCQFCLEYPFTRKEMLEHYDVCPLAPRQNKEQSKQ